MTLVGTLRFAHPTTLKMTMQTHVTFSITENAKRRIVSLTKEYEAKIKKDAIAAIIWLDSDLNDGMVESQPVIGFYHDRSEIEGDIRTVDGLQIVLAIPDHENVRFQGKSLDHENDRFILKQITVPTAMQRRPPSS